MNYISILVIQFLLESSNCQYVQESKVKDNLNTGIDLIISNIRNKQGVIQIGIFDTEKGYPDKPVFSFTLAKDTIFSGKLRLFIPLKKEGLYAITVLDDENKNGRMDYLFGIMPKEGFGFSNNPKMTGRKPPPFNESLINYSGGVKTISVNMKYI
jgi:uncharacterized protein (DUF2141 family)